MAKKRKYIIPIEQLELEEDNYHLLIESHFGDGFIGKWIIDTGASKTVFDIKHKSHFELIESKHTEIKSAGIGDGHIETFIANLPEITFGDLKLFNWSVAVIDLQHINRLYQQFTGETIVGLLGSDFLVQHQAILNVKKLTLTIFN